MKVYLLMKHPPDPYNAHSHLKAGEVVKVSTQRKELDEIAKEKNDRRPRYLWVVHAKSLKEPQR